MLNNYSSVECLRALFSFFFLLFFLFVFCLVTISKMRSAEEVKRGKGKQNTMMLSLRRLGNAALKLKIFK